MAKTYKQILKGEYEIKGNAEDKKRELRSLISTLSREANSRIISLKESGLSQYSHSYQSFKEYHEGELYGQGLAKKEWNDLLKEFREVSTFLQGKTSTPQGVRRELSDIQHRFGYKQASRKTIERLLELYNKFIEYSPNAKRIQGSNRIQEIMGQYYRHDKNVNFSKLESVLDADIDTEELLSLLEEGTSIDEILYFYT